LKTAFVFAAALALAGCGGKKDEKAVEKTPPAGSAVATTPGSAATPGSAGSAVAAGSAVDVPTEEDFESQAKTDITSSNVDTKVKAIEDQLGSN
jgi:hypothetical protein